MSIKDIMVHVDTSPGCEVRLRLAGRLAARLDALLIGVGADDVVARDQFATLLEDEHIPGEWQTVTGLGETDFMQRVRTADLLILGQRSEDPVIGLRIPEQVIPACGRPVLVIPPDGRFATLGKLELGRTALVAWNGSREATRAVHDALPLLAQSDAVTVLAVNPGPDGDRGDRLVAHLTRHGFKTTTEAIETTSYDVAQIILQRVDRLDANLLVMGAYGRARWREKIFGGTTQDVLRMMTVPVLMAH
jgi:nucleotide-binding universal stress UspA family protein